MKVASLADVAAVIWQLSRDSCHVGGTQHDLHAKGTMRVDKSVSMTDQLPAIELLHA